jgi:AcrR family transcriptional regulator
MSTTAARTERAERTERTWRGQTLRDRSADRRDQLISAAIELLGVDGAPGLTMRAVCRTAGLSPRYFYESFTDRDELMLAAFDATVEQMRDAVSTALGGSSDVGDLLRAGVDSAATLIESDRRIGRILFREPFADDALRLHAQAALPGFLLASLGELRIGVTPLASTPDELLALKLSALSGALVALFLDWTDGNFGTDRSAFVDYCTGFVLTLLGGSAA